MVRAFLIPGWRRPFWILVVLLIGVGVGRVALTPWVDGKLREALLQQPDLKGTYSDLSLFSFPPTVVLEDASLEGIDGRSLLSMQRLELHTTWRELIAAVRSDKPKPRVRVRLVQPTLHVRAGDSLAAVRRIQGWLAGAPAAQVEVAAIDDGRVDMALGSQSRSCASDVDATFADVSLPYERPASIAHVGGSPTASGMTKRRLEDLVNTAACQEAARAQTGPATALQL